MNPGFDSPTKVLRMMQAYGDSLCADIPAEDFCKQPVAGMNHPAWTLGHLAFAADRHSRYAGGEPQLTDWETLFGLGSQPSDDPTVYPSKEQLIAAWHAANDRLLAAIESADPARFEEPTQGPLGEALPTVGDFLTFSMTAHTSMHLGQLSAWRRAMGKPAMF